MASMITNWAGNVTFSTRRLHRPGSAGELGRLVSRGQQVRALGTGHSFSPVADTTGDLVSVAGLPRLVETDTARDTVQISAGLRYGEVADALHAAGRALPNLGSLPHISVAGACATGTHGSGIGNPTLASAACGLEMITAEGDLISLSRDDADFAAAVTSLGALGIITSLTLRTVPAYDIRQYVYDGIDREQALAHFEEILAAAYSVSMFLTWRGPVIDQTWLKQRAEQPPPAARWLGGSLAPGGRHPVPGAPAAHCTAQLGRRGPWHERLPHFRADFAPSTGAELQSEYLVPRARGAEALAALGEIGDRLAPVVQTTEIRAVAADGLWLSPAFQRDCAAFHFTWVPDYAAVRPVLAEVEAALGPLAARPHWGKLFAMSPQAVRGQFPRADDFRRLMAHYDPGGKFRNAFLDRYLPG